MTTNGVRAHYFIPANYANTFALSADSKQPYESHGQHVLRYLGTLTAWHTAVKAVMPQVRALRKPLQVYVVKLSDSSSAAKKDAESHLDEAIHFVQSGIRNTAAKDNIEKWMRSRALKWKHRVPRVHAEAGLMALSSYIKTMDGSTLAKSAQIPEDLLPLFKAVCHFAAS